VEAHDLVQIGTTRRSVLSDPKTTQPTINSPVPHLSSLPHFFLDSALRATIIGAKWKLQQLLKIEGNRISLGVSRRLARMSGVGRFKNCTFNLGAIAQRARS
jgi:hypothetical protein